MLLICQQVRFHSAMKHENDVTHIIGSLQVVKTYSFMKEIELYLRALCVVFLSVKLENNFKKEIKHFPCLHSLVKTSAKFVRFLDQVKTFECVLDFTDLFLNSPKHLPRLSPGAMKARRTCFVS